MLRIILNAIEAIGFKNDGISDGLNVGLNVGLNLSELDKDVLTLIASDSFITNAEISEKLAKSIRTIERRIKVLKENNCLERVGAKKTGYWRVLG